MKKRKVRIKKKNKRLLIQTSLLTTFFLIGLILLISFFQFFNIFMSLALGIKKMYDTAEKSLDSYVTYIEPYIINYWAENSDQLKELDQSKLSTEYMDVINSSGYVIYEESFYKLSEHDKSVIAAVEYKYFVGRMPLLYGDGNIDDIYIIDITDNNYGYTIYDYKIQETDNSDNTNDFMKSIGIQKIITPEIKTKINKYIDKTKGIKIDYDKNNTINATNAETTYSIIPIYIDSNPKYAAIIEYNNDYIIDVTKYAFKVFTKSIINILIAILIIDVFVIIFLYLIISKPLVKIKKSIRDYIESHDSERVRSEMKEITSKNEIGELANDFSDLAIEIDRYNNENVMLVKENERINVDLALASGIQSAMLTKDFPEMKELKIYASMTPAKDVGGDFYDFFMIDDQHMALTIADVSGKGVPAALVMMSTLTSIRNYAKLLSTPDEILRNVNEDLCNENIMDMFVTVWLGILDLNTGILTTSNAGHEYPAVNTTGQFELFEDRHGFVIGGMEGMEYVNETIQLKKGDSIFVFTDGIPEANNADQKLYGMNKLLDSLNNTPEADPETILNNVSKAVTDYVGDAPQFDDMTMLCVKYLGE